MPNPLIIEVAKEINFSYPKNTSLEWQHTIKGGYTSAEYKLIIREGLTGEISVTGVKSDTDLITYTVTKTQMSALATGDHPYKTRVVENTESNPVYIYGNIKIV